MSIELYGADALRWTLIAGMGMGVDVILDPNDLEKSFATGRNFAHEAVEHRPLPARPTSATSRDGRSTRSIASSSRAPTSGFSRDSTRRSPSATRARSAASDEAARLADGGLDATTSATPGCDSTSTPRPRAASCGTSSRTGTWSRARRRLDAPRARIAKSRARCSCTRSIARCDCCIPSVPFVTEALWQRLPGHRPRHARSRGGRGPRPPRRRPREERPRSSMSVREAVGGACGRCAADVQRAAGQADRGRRHRRGNGWVDADMFDRWKPRRSSRLTRGTLSVVDRAPAARRRTRCSPMVRRSWSRSAGIIDVDEGVRASAQRAGIAREADSPRVEARLANEKYRRAGDARTSWTSERAKLASGIAAPRATAATRCDRCAARLTRAALLGAGLRVASGVARRAGRSDQAPPELIKHHAGRRRGERDATMRSRDPSSMKS